MNTRRSAKQALDQMDEAAKKGDTHEFYEAKKALCKLLADPEQEPVAWVWPHQLEEVAVYPRRNILAFKHNSKWDDNEKSGRMPLYAAPTVRKPLSEEMVNAYFSLLKANEKSEAFDAQEWFQAGFAIAEAVHGVGDKT